MSVEYRSGEYGLLDSDLVADEVETLVAGLDDLRSRVDCIEGAEGFIGISIIDGVCLNIDKRGLELRCDVHMGSSNAMAIGSIDSPEMESVIKSLTSIVGLTPALVGFGYERKSWGVDETAYTVQFIKKIDISDIEQVYAEVETMIDCFADSNGTT
ncbi:hypothetical protein KC725_04910 [Candidatus Peregrinibacteria bacterium]|nr:hypothetical protein [Candidatus Peregrinibacteria bacterium]